MKKFSHSLLILAMIASTAMPAPQKGLHQRPPRRGARRPMIIPIKQETIKIQTEPKYVDPRTNGFVKPSALRLQLTEETSFEETSSEGTSSEGTSSDKQLIKDVTQILENATEEQILEIFEEIIPVESSAKTTAKAKTKQKRSIQQSVNVTVTPTPEKKSWWKRLNKKQKTLIVTTVAAEMADVGYHVYKNESGNRKNFYKSMYSVKGAKWVGEKVGTQAKNGYNKVKDKVRKQPKTV